MARSCRTNENEEGAPGSARAAGRRAAARTARTARIRRKSVLISFALARRVHEASTALNEMGFPPDVIERQLAHQEPNAVRAAYNRAEYLGERRAMMKYWADCVDVLREGGRVLPLRRVSLPQMA